MKNKKALSGIVTAVIMIALVLALTTIVWGVVNRMVNKELSSTESCFNTFDKVTFSNRYTCYNSTGKKLKFGIDIADIEVDEAIINVYTEAGSKSFRIKKENSTVDYVSGYKGEQEIKLPGKNSGITYILDLEASGIDVPSSMKIAPVINGEQCDVSDTLNEIDSCESLI